VSTAPPAVAPAGNGPSTARYAFGVPSKITTFSLAELSRSGRISWYSGEFVPTPGEFYGRKFDQQYPIGPPARAMGRLDNFDVIRASYDLAAERDERHERFVTVRFHRFGIVPRTWIEQNIANHALPP
jgi:hypothetical protein